MRPSRCVRSIFRRLAGKRRGRSDAGAFSLDGDDREEWDRAWRSMPHRRLPSPPRADLKLDSLPSSGELVACTISQDPLWFSEPGWRRSDGCPVCGDPTSEESRLPASVHARWTSGGRLGFSVWVHRLCFEGLEDAEEPAPVPW